MATSALSRANRWLPLLGGWLVGAVSAQDIPPAYQLAAQRAGVPASVLYALALQESGRRLHGRLVPWPWTLNVAGTPRRFSHRNTACAALRQALREVPPTRIDAGLGQINLGYQRHRYREPCELLEPYRNLAVAATILREQHAPGQNWLITVGRYHRPAGGTSAARYRQGVERHLARVLGVSGQGTQEGEVLP